MYHLSPTTNRTSILQIGLTASRPEIGNKEGVYLWTCLHDHKELVKKMRTAYQEDYGTPPQIPFDIWKVNTTGLALFQDLLEPGDWGAFYHPFSIEVSSIELIASFSGEDEYLGIEELQLSA